MTANFSFLAVLALLGFASTVSVGRNDDDIHIEVSDGQDADDFPEPILEENFEMLNPTHVNGEELFEGDILLSPDQWKAIVQREAIITNPKYRWEAGSDGYPYVPYIFGDSEVNQTAVEEGIAHWEEHTCIKFDTASNLTTPHLRFINGSGCYSYIGRSWTLPGQDISIGIGCTSLGTVAHEIGHAMGLYHEQARTDRDSYIVINTDNIVDGKEHNFLKKPGSLVSNYSIPYDYSSDMHYGGWGFSKNGHLTIATINPLAQELIGSANVLSHRDKLLANRMYPCIEKWLAKCGKTSDPCQNDGYTGANCVCVCPPGTSGTNCENVDGEYYDSLLSSHSEKITSEGNVMSPNYPGKSPKGLKVVKWIVAPECHQVKLTFSSFFMYKQITCRDGLPCCYWDSLEIRTSNLYDGDLYCASMITEGMTFTSNSNQLILFYKTATNNYAYFKTYVEFVKDPTCTPVSTTSSIAITTTTTSTTTTTPPKPGCSLDYYNGVRYWTSPNFGKQNYPNNQRCSLTVGSGMTPRMALIKFQPLFLQKPKKKVCKDKVTIYSRYDVTKSFCGVKKEMTVKLPSMSFKISFESDGRITNKGFNISFAYSEIESPCHKTITLTSLGETGEFKTPFYPKKDKEKKRMCEVWLIAPSSYHIQLDFLDFNLKKPCKKNNLVINPEGYVRYPVESSSFHCGKAKPPTVTSVYNEICFSYIASKPNKGFAVRYTVVELVK